MVADELTRALIEETTLEDISESYRPVVDIIGIEKFIELSEYAKGDELYFPKTENIIAPARNRRIKKEWNGYNSKELAEKYNLTTKQIGNIPYTGTALSKCLVQRLITTGRQTSCNRLMTWFLNRTRSSWQETSM